MVKKVFIFLFLILAFLFPKFAFAKEDFEVKINAEYKVETDGNTLVTNTITIKNLTSTIFAKNYVLTLTGVNSENIKAFEKGRKLPLFQAVEGDSVRLRVEFDEPLAGKGKSRTFIVTYEDASLTLKTGEVWEVSVPKLKNPQSFVEYNVTISIPDSFGEEAYVSPEARKIEFIKDRRIYYFEKDDQSGSGVDIGFGQSQVFNFDLNYHLENNSKKSSKMRIAIPPDTALQKMYYQTLDPKPLNVYLDEDGNWLPEYSLSPKEKLDIKVKGSVQILSKPRKYLQPVASTLLKNTKGNEVWQSDDSAIIELSKTLADPKAIYDYVTKTLSYDLSRVKTQTQRLGAKEALTNPKSAICTEYTDLFIALARARGIPAREINGYAYSENPKIQPLSLVSDVLHAWPEYWDPSKGSWIAIDPTWGSTSGADYFNKMDLKHFTFVIHGIDPTKPYSAGSYKLGNNPQKDVFVTLGALPEGRTPNIQILVDYPKNFFLFSKKVRVKIVNSGSVAVYSLLPRISLDGSVINSSYIEILPPFAAYETSFKISYGIFGSKAPKEVTVSAYRSEIDVPIAKNVSVISQLTLFSIILITAVLTLHFKPGVIVSNITTKIKYLYGKTIKKI